MNGPAYILVVDDETDLELLIRQRFRQKIKNNEIVFDFAYNGVQALEKLAVQEGKYDMILTDINMPEMDGLTLLVNLKEKHKEQKAVVVSAYGDMENIRTAMNRGAFDFVTKPIDFADLEITIDKTISENRALRLGKLASEQLEVTIRQKELAEYEKQRAEQSEKFKQQFLANMSHEIRTPMNSVMGLTNLLIKTNLDEQQKKYLNVIKRSSENLLVIINDILDLSKIEAGKMDFEKISFPIEDVLETVYHTLYYKADEKRIEFKTNLNPNVPKILIGDPTRLNQVLINIAGNAIKFTEKGRVIVDVEEVNKQGNLSIVRFSIIDTGIGIAPENIEKIFDSFSQATSDTTRKFGGTGLGLSISKQLVDLQGGKIEVYSVLQEGTTFSITMPFLAGQESDVGAQRHSHDDVKGSELKGIRVLLVEDNPFNQLVATDTLNDLIGDLTIDVAENGRIAVELVKNNVYDIVLMDIQMPELDGFETTRAIRLLSSPKNEIKIMAMTANVTSEEIAKCFQSGMNDYISKPFDSQDLLNKLGKLLSTTVKS